MSRGYAVDESVDHKEIDVVVVTAPDVFFKKILSALTIAPSRGPSYEYTSPQLRVPVALFLPFIPLCANRPRTKCAGKSENNTVQLNEALRFQNCFDNSLS